MDLQIAPSNVHHWTFFSLPHAFLSMQIIKYAYVCVHMNLRVIRFYMQMPCEYWCFLVDDPNFLMITVFVIIIFSAVNQVVLYFNIRYCHCYPGLKATLHREKELERFLAEVSSFSKSILNPWQDVLGSALEDQSLHCMRIPRVTVSTLSVFQRVTVVKNLIFPVYCFVLVAECSRHNQAKVTTVFCFESVVLCCLCEQWDIFDWFPPPAFFSMFTPSS